MSENDSPSRATRALLRKVMTAPMKFAGGTFDNFILCRGKEETSCASQRGLMMAMRREM